MGNWIGERGVGRDDHGDAGSSAGQRDGAEKAAVRPALLLTPIRLASCDLDRLAEQYVPGVRVAEPIAGDDQ
jgi:hypothetical protein